jgi:hypothetical protein
MTAELTSLAPFSRPIAAGPNRFPSAAIGDTRGGPATRIVGESNVAAHKFVKIVSRFPPALIYRHQLSTASAIAFVQSTRSRIETCSFG